MLKSRPTLVGYSFDGDKTGRAFYVFTRLAVVASQICEIPRNSLRIRNYSSLRSSKVIDLGVNRMRIIIQRPI